MKRALILLAVASTLGLTACAGTKAPPPVYVCESGTQAQGTAPASNPPPPDQPLPPETAGEIAKNEVATADMHTPDGRVPLVTVEETGGVPEIKSTPVATPEEGEVVAEQAAADGDLLIVEADSVVTAEVDPDDPRFLSGEQYALPATRFVETWNGVFTGVGAGAGQIVAVLDTGVEKNHEDLMSQVLLGRVLAGQSYPGSPGGTTDVNGHGTRLAGIIAALTNNNKGIAGGAPAAHILPVQVLNSQGQGASSDVANGIYWAILEGGATVINLSLGGPNASQTLQAAVQWAVHAAGVPVIASAGNSGRCGEPSYPGAFVEALAVAATDAGNNWAAFSTTGPYVDIAAPGVGILSTNPFPNPNCPIYCVGNGTSFAAPYVAAAAAIVRATHPGFGPGDVYNYLMFTAADLGSPGWDPFFGWGLLNVFAAATTP